MAKNRISDLDVTSISPLKVSDGSYEARVIDPRYIQVVTGNIVNKYLTSSSVSGDASLYQPSVNDELYEKPGVPHMADITVVKNNTYVDKKNNVRTTIVFKVKNSSEEEIAGVDARLEVKTGDDQ